MSAAQRFESAVGQWFTTHEILQQSDVWRGFAPALSLLANEIRGWLARRDHDEIWFCGAGTSAFIGETLASHLNRGGRARFRPIPTTDFVASPMAYMRDGVRVLVVSFGRSGNSSETVAMLDMLDLRAPQYDRLNITCNEDSSLARQANRGPGELRTLIMPAPTNDRGFAMTSSYTTMLLSALACFDVTPPAPVEAMMARLSDAARVLIDRNFDRLADFSPPARAVFLGSGPLTGVARESALKVLELAAGRITTSWDSTLGFRHGPKAVVDDETVVFVFESGDPHTGLYDADLAREIAVQFGDAVAVRVGPAEDAHIQVQSVGNDAWSAVLYVIVAQMLSVIWSARLGLHVDDPFAGRNLARVVTGVKLHGLPPARRAAFGAMDVGGTKIEATLFNGELEPIETSRVNTATQSYAALVDSIAERAGWLRAKGGEDLAFGIGLPGLIDRRTGESTTSNLPATGHNLGADLAARLGRGVVIENDCKCFALSEANGGAGEGFRTVFGLIMGTGLGGGVCVDGRLQTALNGLPGEVGHFGIPAELVAKHELPLVRCGCGRTGCYETLVSGPGMSRIADRIAGRPVSPEEIKEAAQSDPEMARVYDIWLDLLCELMHTIQLTIDPDCVVLGGGLSRIDGLATRLAERFARHKLPGVRSPAFRTARFGDASGVRGAAILARRAS